MAEVIIANVVGIGDETVEVEITINSLVPVIGFHINISFDGMALPDAVGAGGPTFPTDWFLDSHLAGPGDLRFIALDLTGGSATLSGSVLRATFDILPAALSGKVTITTSLTTILDTDLVALPVSVLPGSVLVLGLGDVTEDGLLNVSDVIHVLQYLIGRVSFTLRQLSLADFDQSGTVELVDAIKMLRDIVGL